MLKMSHLSAIELLVLIAGVGTAAAVRRKVRAEADDTVTAEFTAEADDTVTAEFTAEADATVAAESTAETDATITAEFTANASCHPWNHKTKKIFVKGWDKGSLNKWLSFSWDGKWLYARYPREADAMPLYFDAFPAYCNTYYLRNDWINQGQKYVSFRNNGHWLRSIYNRHDAMPIMFAAQGGNKFKMLNKYPGEDYWVSYTNNDKALRATYQQRDAMIVTLKDVPGMGDPHTIEVCFDEVFANHGGSSGTQRIVSKYRKGVETTTSQTNTHVSRVATELTAAIPLEGFTLNPSIQTSLESTVQTASSQTTSMSSEREHTVEADMSKPCFVYQAVITITYNSGKKAILKGEPTNQFDHPLNQRCTFETV